MFNSVKGFCKVQFHNDYLLLRMMTLVNVFKTPCQAILNGSELNETILIPVDNLKHNLLESLCQKFGQHLDTAAKQEIGLKSKAVMGLLILGTNTMKELLIGDKFTLLS